MMVFENKYEFGQIVYLKTDCDQVQRIVTKFEVEPNGLLYQLSQGKDCSWHYEFEISETQNVALKTSNI